jgi:hypothetical protein
MGVLLFAAQAAEAKQLAFTEHYLPSYIPVTKIALKVFRPLSANRQRERHW